MIEYNNRTVYDWFNNPFPVDGVSPSLNIPPIPIGDITRLNKISQYSFDPLPYAIYVAYGNSGNALTTVTYREKGGTTRTHARTGTRAPFQILRR